MSTGGQERVDRIGMLRQNVEAEQIESRQAERTNGVGCHLRRACPNDLAGSTGDGYMIDEKEQQG